MNHTNFCNITELTKRKDARTKAKQEQLPTINFIHLTGKFIKKIISSSQVIARAFSILKTVHVMPLLLSDIHRNFI